MGRNYPSPVTAWSTVGILSLTYMFSFMDRQILVLLIDPIKNDLNITDTQVSLLTGLAFASVYTLLGIPMGRAADLWVRKYVVIFGVAIWSILTVLCGLSRNFTQLFLARMGVGFGEAALTPTAYSMVSDLFPPNRLARGMSVFALGGTIGGGVSLIFGGAVIGWVADISSLTLPVVGSLQPWQLVLIVVGFASLLMVLPLSFIPEPRRHESLEKLSSTVQPTEARKNLTFKEVLKYLWTHKVFYGPFVAGIALLNLFGYGVLAWIPTYFIRVHGWDAAQTGMTLGLLGIVPTIIGSLLGGWLSDYFYGKGYRGAPLYLLVFAIVILLPVIPALIYAPIMELRLGLMVLFFLVGSVPAVLSPTIVQMVTHNRIRAQVSAIYLLIINLIGIGAGPTAIALITDYGFGDDKAVGHSIVIAGIVAYVLAVVLLFFAITPFKKKVTLLGDADTQESVIALPDVDPNAAKFSSPVK